MRNLVELGMEPRRLNPYLAPPNELIRAFESHFEIRLPTDFVEFLRFANGGRPSLRLYHDPRGGFGEVNDFYGLGTREADEMVLSRDPDGWDIGNLWGETRIWRPILGSASVPIARDGGNNQLFFRVGADGSRVYRLTASNRNAVEIAGTFSDFIDMLQLALPVQK